MLQEVYRQDINYTPFIPKAERAPSRMNNSTHDGVLAFINIDRVPLTSYHVAVCPYSRGILFLDILNTRLNFLGAQKAIALIQSCFQFDPQMRPSIADLLRHPWFRT